MLLLFEVKPLAACGLVGAKPIAYASANHRQAETTPPVLFFSHPQVRAPSHFCSEM
jgi:hypothetical protein